MMEVYLLGILVSMIKLAKMARIIPGPALFSFIALIFVLAAASVSLDTHLVWDFFQSSPQSDEGFFQSSLSSDEDFFQSSLKSDEDHLEPPPEGIQLNRQS